MELSEKLLKELQRRLKVGNRRGVHLNAIPGISRYKFDLMRLSNIDKDLPANFIEALLSEQPLKFKISWKDNVPDLNSLFEEDQTQLVKITKSFENLINQTEAIESEKGINTFGFGFPILVRRDKQDNKLTIAPILIWSLRIRKTAKEFNTWEILRGEDDPIYINEVLINHLNSDSNVELDQIPSEMLDDGFLNKDELISLCYRIISTVNSTVPSDIKDTFNVKIKQLSSIPDKKHFESLLNNSSNSLIHFGGLFSIFEVQKQNIIDDFDGLLDLKGLGIELGALENHEFQSISSVETDPSQQGILNALQTNRNLLIQGPPGTGKSQSLTAILINALENKKKTIVVCEKRTALEVLHNALIDKGLFFNCILIKDIIKDRRLVVDSVRDRIDNASYRRYRYVYSKDILNNLIGKTKSIISSINNKHVKVDTKLIDRSSWTDIVGQLLKSIKDLNEDSAPFITNLVFDFSSNELNELLDNVSRGQILYKRYSPYEKMSFLNPKKLIGDNIYTLEQQLIKDFEHYSLTLSDFEKCIENYKQQYLKERKDELLNQKAILINLSDEIIELLDRYTDSPDFLDLYKTSGIVFKISAVFSNIKKQLLKDQETVLRLYNDLQDKILAFTDIRHNILADPKLIRKEISTLLTSIGDSESSFDSKLKDEFDSINLFADLPDKFQTESLQKVKAKGKQLIDEISEHAWSVLRIKSDSHISLIGSVGELIKKQFDYISNEEDIFSLECKWMQFHNALSEEQQELIDNLRPHINWKSTFLAFYLNKMLINAASDDLPTNDHDYSHLQDTLNDFEKEQLKFIKQYWHSSQIDLTKEFEIKNVNLSVENLYNKKSSNKFRRLSLREIVKYDTDLFTTFFPVILTTPDVCSNLFKGMNGYFDIVLFDEASQLRLEDNLPAILKGKQIVIAGDEHQMPPSNYFDKIFDGSYDDEDDLEEEEELVIDRDNILLSCESLLDFASELSFEKRFLDFHYRSRHPDLIDFSNYAFYNRRLKPLPNNFDYTPIKYVQTGGTFSEHTNEIEAETVISILESNINRLPNGNYPTVGIATFNITQRNLIKSKIAERRKFDRFSAFNEKMLELEQNGFFIKNLENIQGDERDVIILSTTYGIGKDGKFNQRFGPINHKKGYKLLNVIITRAKFKIYVCTSVPEKVFLNFKEHLTVEGANNRRAAFFSYLAYSKAISEKNIELKNSVLESLLANTTKKTELDILNEELESPFEEEVYDALLQHFKPAQVIPQLQFAGFRIDIVVDLGLESISKVAIECDGAKYHSSSEAYLHDIYRQKILEEHGFVFHRIWSTNWWRNPKREINKLIEFIQNLKENKIQSQLIDANFSSAFDDTLPNLNIIQNELSFSNTTFEDIIDSFDSDSPVQKTLFSDSVGLNSIVKIKYLNNDKIVTVKLVDSVYTDTKIVNGIQQLNYQSPLGFALKGAYQGQIVKVGDLDNFVEILNVQNS